MASNASDIDDKLCLLGIHSFSPKAYDLKQLLESIEEANDFIQSNTLSKLSVISQQIQYLYNEAKSILKEAKLNNELHNVACNFVKLPGHVYHLYEQPNGNKYFSMLSPEEWGPKCPHKFINSFFLNMDRSWKVVHSNDSSRVEDLYNNYISFTENKALNIDLANKD